MPKLENNGLIQKISLAQIIDTGNVRENYEDIEELAQSIKNDGLMQPIVVKRAGTDPNGIQQYELIAGHRRKKAFEYLCSKGDDFNMIDAVIKTGDKLTLQLIENIQRSDLTAAERESGLAEMLATGISQREIAAKLSKTEQWVSKHLAAHRIRKFLQQQNIDTEKYETTTLNLFRTVPESDLVVLIKKADTLGGTRTAFETVFREYKNKSVEPEVPKTVRVEKAEQTYDTTDIIGNEMHVAPSNDLKVKSETKKISEPKQPQDVRNKSAYDTPIEPEDKLLSAKFVFGEIDAYIKAVESKIKTLETETEKKLQAAKIDAAYDIIALLHRGD